MEQTLEEFRRAVEDPYGRLKNWKLANKKKIIEALTAADIPDRVKNNFIDLLRKKGHIVTKYSKRWGWRNK